MFQVCALTLKQTWQGSVEVTGDEKSEVKSCMYEWYMIGSTSGARKDVDDVMLIIWKGN